MNNNYFTENETLYDITSKYPNTIDVFASNGFPDMQEAGKREVLGKNITLKQAMLIKGKSLQLFSKLLIEAIEQDKDSEDVSLKNSSSDAEIKLVGALPCPVRIPLLEKLDNFNTKLKEEKDVSIFHDLKAASQGASWLEKYILSAKEIEELPDIFISAGFETFFDKNGIGKFKEEGAFHDYTEYNDLRDEFKEIDILDPKKDYSMISVVPAVFLVNTNELDDPTQIPESWADILDEKYKNRISLPVGDFDLFASILIHIYKEYGEEGVKKLGTNLLESLHPSEMVKSDKKKKAKPIVTIMPYFFTKMTKNGGPMVAVWPKDGAIISPIFLLSKKTENNDVKEAVNFLASKEIGEILSHKGLFPSLNPEVDNNLPKENKFMWVGWDYIYNNDIPKIIAKCEEIFNQSIGAK
jgi:ABC-type Fe3+ transport system substrate-binding protein